jgi:hypothetical protein
MWSRKVRNFLRAALLLLWLAPLVGQAQITLGYTNWNGVQSGTATNTTVSTVSGTTQTTNSTFVILVSNQSNSVPTVTDNKGNTIPAAASTVSMFSQQISSIFYCINCAGGTGHIFTATWSTACTLASIGVVEFKNVGAATLDVNATSVFNGSGNSPTTATSITTSAANELVVNGWAAYSGGAQTISDSTGWTNAVKYQTGTYQPGAISYQIPASSGTAVADTFTYSAFGYSGALGLSIKQSTGASCTHNFWKSTGAFAQPDGTTGSYWNLTTGAFSTPDCSTGNFWRQDGAKAAN